MHDVEHIVALGEFKGGLGVTFAGFRFPKLLIVA
jgi:hypothetical protein